MSDVLPRLSTALADRYKVERELGVGGMATVYLAHDLKHERDVALKVLHPELAAVLGAERFLTEIKTTAKLQHPHILPLLDSGEAGGLLFYVMPVVDGESLRAHLQRETQLPVDEAIRITKEVGSALDYAHRHGVIHRDIKPENILLHDNSALVTDFGIALAVTAAGGARLTQTGLSLGTPQYMAPEQAMGEKSVDARADVYALGCVLYEMLAGQAPFTGPTAQAIVAQVLTTDALPVTTHRKTVPPNVARAVHAALQKLPADRFSTIAEFTGALDGATTSAAMRGHVAEAGGSVRPSSARMWGYVTAGLAVGVAIGSFAFKGTNAATTSEPRYYQIALPDTAPFTSGANMFDMALVSLAISRDGRSVAYVAATPSGQRIALARLDRGTVSVLGGTEGGYAPIFSPDGQSIAFATGRKLQRIAVADGTVTGLGDITYLFGWFWATDGRVYVKGIASDSRNCFGSVPEGGGAPTMIPYYSCGGAEVVVPADPAGRAVFGSSLGSGVMIFEPKSDSAKPLLGPDGAPVRASGVLAVSPKRLLLFGDSAIYAAPMELAAGRLTAQPVALLSSVRREAWAGQAQAAISADGTLVWAAGGDGALANFVWLDRNGVLKDTALKAGAIVSSYALSPDANRIAYSTIDASGRPHLLVADLRRAVTDEVPFDGELQPENWIRRGTAFTALWLGPRGRNKGRVIVDLTGPRARVDTIAGFADEARDGGARCMQAGNVTLVRGPGFRDSVRVVDEYGDWCRFSPDASRIAWNGGGGVFVTRTSGDVAASRVRVAPAGADEPRWSEDGRIIFFRDGNAWYAVDAPTPEMRFSGTVRKLFQGSYLQARASWERAADGRLLMLQGLAPPRLRTLNVMTNFTTLMEEKLKAGRK